MHYKFLVFLLIVFFFFLNFSSACEFRFIERIGAHGKQNPDFIIIIIRNLHCADVLYLLALGCGSFDFVDIYGTLF